MKTDLKITDVKNVFEGEFKPGKLPKKDGGRHCDCFVYYLYGKAEYVFDDYSFVAMPKNFVYLSKNSVYSMNVSENSKFICVDFEFGGLTTVQKSNVFECNPQFAKNQFQKMFHIQSEKKLSYLPQIFSCVYNIYSEAIKAENKLYSKRESYVSDIIAYILAHYTEEDFSIKELSRHFSISETHLRRVFGQSVHISPIKYINQLKLDKAKNMICTSNYSISEIAQKVGIDDPYYFSRFFKKETGVSPSEYRRARM